MTRFKKTVVQIPSMYIDRELLEKAKEELHKKAMMSYAGIDNEPQPCQTIVFHLLQKMEEKI